MKRLPVLIILFMLLIVIAGCREEEKKNVDPPKSKPKEEAIIYKEKSILTGMPVAANRGVMAVMVENFKTARPQSGLDKADIVYEMLAEGGITRFIAIYSGQEADEIGPIRSARPYFVAVAREWGAIFVHYGGTPEGYQAIKSFGVTDIDGMTKTNLFWRDKSRKAPHNAYGNTHKFRTFKDNPAPPSKRWDIIEYKEAPAFNEIIIPYNSETTVKYSFDKKVGRYLRFINNAPHMDRSTGKQLAATNIVVQYARHSLLKDKVHYDVALQGQGKAEFFLGRKYISGTWKKENLASPTQYFDESGQPVKFTPGNIWVQVFPSFQNIKKNNV